MVLEKTHQLVNAMNGSYLSIKTGILLWKNPKKTLQHLKNAEIALKFLHHLDGVVWVAKSNDISCRDGNCRSKVTLNNLINNKIDSFP